jgi:hypothetical protein
MSLRADQLEFVAQVNAFQRGFDVSIVQQSQQPMAQSSGGSAGGSSQAVGPADNKTATGESMSGSTTGGGAKAL